MTERRERKYPGYLIPVAIDDQIRPRKTILRRNKQGIMIGQPQTRGIALFIKDWQKNADTLQLEIREKIEREIVHQAEFDIKLGTTYWLSATPYLFQLQASLTPHKKPAILFLVEAPEGLIHTTESHVLRRKPSNVGLPRHSRKKPKTHY